MTSNNKDSKVLGEVGIYDKAQPTAKVKAQKHNPYAAFAAIPFRYFLACRFMATIGFQIQSVAVGWLVYSITKDPLSLGLIGLSEVVPNVLVSLYAGYLVDVTSRKYIVLISQSVLAVSVLILGYVAWLHQSGSGVDADRYQLTLIYSATAITGIARGFLGPAYFGQMGELIPRALYTNAASWQSSSWQVAAVTGPALGGVLYGLVGPTVTFTIATLLVTVAMGFQLFGVPLGPKPHGDTDRPPIGASIKEGLAFVFRNKIIVGALTLDLFAVLFGGAVSLLPVFADQVLSMGASGLGLLRSAPSAGAVLMALYQSYRPFKSADGPRLLWAVAGFGLCMIGFGLSTSFMLSLLLLAVSGGLDNISVVVRMNIVQTLTPDKMRGRVSAVESIFIGSSNELGEFESGVMAKAMGLVPSVVLGGALSVGVVGLVAYFIPNLRRLYKPEYVVDKNHI